MKKTLPIYLALVLPVCGAAQGGLGSRTPSSLPSAPMPRQVILPATSSAPMAGPQSSTPQNSAPQNNAPQNNAPPNNPGTPTMLSLKDAQALALKNNPQISLARLTALASQQVTREVRSNLWPTAVIDLTAVDSDPGSRITAGALNNPSVYPRAAAGATVSQLLTDFGRTTNLISSANLAAKAENQNAVATKEQVLLAVDQAFYNALQAQAVLVVARQTVADRQTVSDQVGALYRNKLKSELDFSFANVNLAQAKLLLLDAQNSQNAALASLSAVLGFPSLQNFQLAEDTTAIAPPQANIDDLICTAFGMRPEILSLEFQVESAKKFHTAERDLFFPDIQALGAVGDTPVRNPVLSSWYGAVGVNVGIPVFNGFLYSARAREAALKAQAAQERLRDLRDRISRDVRTSWLNATTAYDRLAVTEQLLEQANLALDLAQARYKLGLGSIVELSQAQLQQTQAQITNAQAGYDCRLALAVLQYQTTGF
ncbi:MAG: TolC family protein [Terriglobales bacterium]|jgi:outer membrane protein